MHNCNKFQCSFLSPLFYIFINKNNYYKLYCNFSRPQISIPWAKIQFSPPSVCINNVLLKTISIHLYWASCFVLYIWYGFLACMPSSEYRCPFQTVLKSFKKLYLLLRLDLIWETFAFLSYQKSSPLSLCYFKNWCV